MDKSILSHFYQFEKANSNRPFLKQPLKGKPSVILSWSEAAKEARILANKIKSLGLPEKSNIGILSKNCAHWIITDLAIMMSGHVSVPLYPTLQADTINYILKHSECKLLFVGKLDTWNDQKTGNLDLCPLVSYPYWENEETTSWNEFIKDASPLEGDLIPEEDEIASIIYTSGTTGNPKGVVHTFKSLYIQVHDALQEFKLGIDDRFFSYLPLSHVAERALVEFGAIYAGGSISFAESLETFKDDLVEAKPTIFMAVPRIWTKFQQGILQKIPEKKLSLFLNIPLLNNIIRNKVKAGLGLDETIYFFTGAAAISKDLLQWFDQLGIRIYECYGMTENFCITTINTPSNIKLGTVGKQLGAGEAKIADNGEILYRGPGVMQGYYKDSENTTETIDQDGWLHTGDKGQFNSEGYLNITGRVKDLFKTSKGKYVAPAPIENLFAKATIIEQVCVVGSGLPSPIALVILSEDAKKLNETEVQKTLNDLLKLINNEVENFERLKKIVILKDEWSVETGLMTPTLKIKRSLIEKKYEPYIHKWNNENYTISFK
ncbi:AMP-binding protein [Bacteriovoracaceae bacterium]|nr:AMP-binding protein [Bacteriovoracaceae bacterium]